MKLSVSVPDSLWAEVANGSDSPSLVIQTGLRLLAERRRGDTQRLLARSKGSIYDTAEADDDLTRGLEEQLDKLVRSARDDRQNAYCVGVDAALSLPWSLLDRLPVDIEGCLIDAFTHGPDSDGLDQLAERILSCASEYELHEYFPADDVPSQTMLQAAAEGIADVREAARRRLAQPDDGGPRS